MKLKENSIVKLISKESLLHVVKNVQILSLGYVKHVLYKNYTVWTTHNVKHLMINLNKLYKVYMSGSALQFKKCFDWWFLLKSTTTWCQVESVTILYNFFSALCHYLVNQTNLSRLEISQVYLWFELKLFLLSFPLSFTLITPCL